jgi:hypothetical protein
MQSLRRTLSVRFTLTMFVALLVIALWAYLGARRVLRRELDQGLVAAARIEAALVATGRMLPGQGAGRDRAGFVNEVNRFAVVRDGSGAVLDANTRLAAGLPADSALSSGPPAAGATMPSARSICPWATPAAVTRASCRWRRRWDRSGPPAGKCCC